MTMSFSFVFKKNIILPFKKQNKLLWGKKRGLAVQPNMQKNEYF